MDSYYQRTINSILESVKESYASILIEQETDFIERVSSLEPNSQRLLYRLLLRKNGWFRAEKLTYTDIDTADAIESLRKSDFILMESSDPGVYLEILSLEELKGFCKKRLLTVNGKQKRSDLIDCILTSKVQKQAKLSFGIGKQLQATKSESILDQVQSICGRIIRLHDDHVETFTRLTSMFFLTTSSVGDPSENNLATAILSDLNRRRYAKYEIKRSAPLFTERASWINYELAQTFCSGLFNIFESDSGEITSEQMNTVNIEMYHSDLMVRWTEEISIAAYNNRRYFLRRFSAGWVYTKCLHHLADYYEKQKQYDYAVAILETLLSQDLFCHGRRGQWWERLIINLSRHLKQPEKALEACKVGLADRHVRTDSRISLKRRMAKLEKSDDWEEFPIEEVVIDGALVDVGTSGRKLIFQIDEDTKGSVEKLVLHHFSENGGWSGMHTESSVYTSLYIIMFWDIIFAPIPDVFQNQYQAAPLDFGTDNFYQERKALIDERLAEIKSESYWKDQLVESYNTHHGTICVGASWESYSLEELWNVMRSVGGPAISVIFRIFSEDYRNNRSGMPDLIMWRTDPDDDRRLQHLLVEVKSTRDRLSDQQRHWAWIFSQSEIRMIVCKVKHA